jgi:hypothetical protein
VNRRAPYALSLERRKTRAEVGGGTADHDDCGLAPRHAEAGYRSMG